METKIEQIREILKGEKISVCKTILQNIERDINDRLFELRDNAVF